MQHQLQVTVLVAPFSSSLSALNLDRWDDDCIYMGVLGGKNNSHKYLSSDQAWYNVTWDDGSKAQVVLVDLTGRASEPLAGSLGDPPV